MYLRYRWPIPAGESSSVVTLGQPSPLSIFASLVHTTFYTLLFHTLLPQLLATVQADYHLSFALLCRECVRQE
jgi:hypothetical protein